MDIYSKHSIPPAVFQEVTHQAKVWAGSNGLQMRDRENPNLSKHAPFTLFPSCFPKYLYEEAFKVQTDFQSLFHKVSLDNDFIRDSLKSVIIHDEFTKTQYEIYDQVQKEGIQPRIHFDIARSDYMMNQVDLNYDQTKPLRETRPYEIKQIEMNMIAASFQGLSSIMPGLHRYIAEELGELSPFSMEKLADKVPVHILGEGMAKAFKFYGNEDAIVLFVNETKESNRFDQQRLVYAFTEGCKKVGVTKYVQCKFRNLDEIGENGRLDDDRRFYLDDKEVALCYFRSGYTPTQLGSQTRIATRLMIERSICIKSPTMAMQLVGTKKIQQVLAMPGVVERFIKDQATVERIRKTFAGLFSLDEGKDGDEAAAQALAEPTRFVLKPQREGGGNNMYEDELVAELKRVSNKPDERSQYILMERLRPPINKNYLVKHDEVVPAVSDTVSELGVFGYHLSVDGEEKIFNETAGHLLRTKSIDHNDGGVDAGRAVLDTPLLMP